VSLVIVLVVSSFRRSSNETRGGLNGVIIIPTYTRRSTFPSCAVLSADPRPEGSVGDTRRGPGDSPTSMARTMREHFDHARGKLTASL